jgi:hypothetical protein
MYLIMLKYTQNLGHSERNEKYVQKWIVKSKNCEFVVLDSLAVGHSGRAVRRHEMPFAAETLGSWVRIPLEAWVFVCSFLCFCCPV